MTLTQFHNASDGAGERRQAGGNHWLPKLNLGLFYEASEELSRCEEGAHRYRRWGEVISASGAMLLAFKNSFTLFLQNLSSVLYSSLK